MTFLNPLVLIGLVAAGIPLLIHLFNFRRPRKVDFSSLMFLHELRQTTMQRVRIKQWLLLLLRTAAIASLVLAFARPTLEGPIAGAIGGDGQTATVLVIDNSLSMSLSDGVGVYLDQAKDLSATLLDLMKSGDQVAVITTTDVGGAEVHWLKTRESALDAVASVNPSYAPADIAAAVVRAADAASAASFVNREVFVFSDFQTTTTGDLDIDAQTDGIAVRIIKVGSGDSPNAAVHSVRIVSRILEVNQPVKLKADIVAFGEGQETDNVVSVFLDDRRVAQASVDVVPGTRQTVDLTVVPRETGWLAGAVRIEPDDFAFDDEAFFALHVPAQRKILLVHAESFDARHLQLALSPQLSPGRTRFDVDTVPPSRLPATRLSNYDVVVLAGVADFSTGELTLLENYVREGGGLLLFPPQEIVDGSGFGDLLGRLDGGSVESMVESSGGGAGFLLGRVEFEHPLFEGVFENREGGGGLKLERTEVHRFASYRPAHPSEQTLIALSSDRPFLQELRPGNGLVLFMTALPDLAWTDLPVRGLFIPLMYRTLHYLSAGETEAMDGLIVGVDSDLRIPLAVDAEVVRMVTADGELVPRQRTAFGGVLITAGADVPRPGNADLVVANSVVRKVGVNLDGSESDLTSLSADEATAWAVSSGLNARQMAVNEGSAAFERAVQTLRSGVELWNVFLTVALVILLAEMLVARHWKPETASV